MFVVYSLLFVLGALLVAPAYVWRYRKKHFLRKSWRERLGYLPDSIHPQQSGAIWIHAVSVGETLAVAGLADALAEQYPGRPIYLSHVTPTGREAGEKRLSQVAGRFYLPLDMPGPVHRVMRRLRPSLLLIVETELWPNLLRAAHRSGAQVVLINARLSDRSAKGYRLLRPFMRRVFENADWILAQTPQDAERFRRIGARPERVLMMGNLKFDSRPLSSNEFAAALKIALAAADRSPVVVAASTMPGEEELVLRAWSEVKKADPRSILILAPRHPTRFDEVARLLGDRGHAFVRRSALGAGSQATISGAGQLAAAEVLLLDSLGELAGIFELASVVFIGGSLVPTGGHNLIEAAVWGKPVIFGPHMENFRDAARLLLEAHGAIQAADWTALAAAILKLLGDEAERRRMGEAARNVTERESGATARILDHIASLLGEDASSQRRPSA
ncbi:MAG: 3-deoxy-D-manno-octulosonic acid transferase [Acidobacteriota bacterium]|nr:3-deoxy-D-manno-octulosonic acid transferase [Acidobacteriota bacterium]